jgi:hypothetical protein
VRDRHVEQLVELCVPGGVALFATDALSSRAYPALPRVPAHQLPDFLTHLAETDACFLGTNPRYVDAVLRAKPATLRRLADISYVAPWLWTAPGAAFLVYALLVRCRAGD